jgi:nitroreductase
MIEDLIKGNRSYRRFYQEEPISAETLRWLVNLARMGGSAWNLQPLRFFLSHERATNDAIFSCLLWAAYLPDWPGPPPAEQPAAYIVILGDTKSSAFCDIDLGIAAQSILLGAREKGLGGCMIARFNRERLREVLQTPEKYDLLLVVALGKPKEEVVMEDLAPGGSVKYWRDERGVHHVPKRRLEDLIIN